MRIIVLLLVLTNTSVIHGFHCPKYCSCLHVPISNNSLQVSCYSKEVPVGFPIQTTVLSLNGLHDLSGLRNCQNLTNLQSLIIGKSMITNLHNNSFLGVGSILALTLNLFRLQSIDPYAFQPLNKLEQIEFDLIPMRLRDLTNAFSGFNNRTLKRITIRCIGSKMAEAEVLDETVYRGFKELNITHLTVTYCSIAVARKGYSKYLPNLKHLNLSHNYISGDKTSAVELLYLNNLELLDGSYQHVMSGDNEGLHSASEADNTLKRSSSTVYRLPPNLKHIYLHHWMAYMNRIDVYVSPDNMLKYIDISGNFLSEIAKPFRGFEELEFLNMQSVSLRNFTLNAFQYFPTITTILLGNNAIGQIIQEDINGKVFGKNSYLTSLDMRRCSIQTLPDNFMYSIRGVRYLNLSDNSLTGLNITASTQLLLLNISNNKFTMLPNNFIDAVKRITENTHGSERFVLDLSNNPVTLERPCCSVVSLLRLSNNPNNKLHLYKSENYQCINGNKLSKFTDINLIRLKHVCFPPIWKERVLYPSVALGVIVFCITVSVIFYRRRWCFRSYYLAGKRYLRSQRQIDEETFRFDAFVAYHEANTTWVINDLKHKLEDVYGFRLCLHQRDFLPGEAIEDNISNAIEVSKRVILILSPAFITSNWCLIEMRLARQAAIDRGYDILIPVILQKFDFTQTTMTLVNILKEQTYINWPGQNLQGQSVFWQRLCNALTH